MEPFSLRLVRFPVSYTYVSTLRFLSRFATHRRKEWRCTLLGSFASESIRQTNGYHRSLKFQPPFSFHSTLFQIVNSSDLCIVSSIHENSNRTHTTYRQFVRKKQERVGNGCPLPEIFGSGDLPTPPRSRRSAPDEYPARCPSSVCRTSPPSFPSYRLTKECIGAKKR